MIEYVCPECNVSEFSYIIILKKKCPKCDKLMDTVEDNEQY